jgi:hypothetical protein
MKLGRIIEVKNSLDTFLKNTSSKINPEKIFSFGRSGCQKMTKILIDTLLKTFKDHFVKSQFRSIKTFDLIFKRNHPKN